MEYHSAHEPPSGSVASRAPIPADAPRSLPTTQPPQPAQDVQMPPPPPASDTPPDPSTSPRPAEIVRYNSANGRKYVYPAATVPNPAIALMPLTTTDAVLGELERPHYIPMDLDARVDRASVWMKTVPGTGEVVFFIPGSCSECLRLQQHCDRSSPVCGRCQKREATCKLQGFKHLRPSAPVHDRRPPPADKGKGRQANGAGDESDAEGRGKRVKKKRRLSASDEMDPNTLNFDGTGIRKARARVPKPITQLPPSSSAGYLRPEDVTPTDEDAKYAVLAAREAPALDDPRGIPPFWAARRRSLQAALLYFRDPVRTNGAAVDIGPSGVARGIILDGSPNESAEAHFFGTGERAGTILTNIGKPRQRHWSAQSPAQRNVSPTPPRETPSIADDFQRALLGSSSNGHTSVNGNGNGNVAPASAPVAGTSSPEEERVVEALLMAHRAGTPVAVAVTPAYTHTPFKVTKDYLGLGWFWILDAWTELAQNQKPEVSESDKAVIWRFRLEWCSGQPEPWWSSRSDADRAGPDLGERVSDDKTVNAVRKAGSPTRTLRGTPGEQAHGSRCGACDRCSSDVYDQPVCLNEECVRMRWDSQPRVPSASLSYGGVLIEPEALGMTFARPSIPRATVDLKRLDAARDMWHAWVCARCHLANERRDWTGLVCEWCCHTDFPRRRIYAAEALRAPRPVATGARNEEGFASWASEGGQTSALFPDEVKAVRWQLPWAEVVHVLGHEGVSLVPNAVLKGLQIQGRDEVRFRRQALPATSSRPAELAVSPFYTFLAGPDGVPLVTHLPTSAATKWASSPKVTLDAMDLVNERAGRIYPGDPEFNSLLLAALPPQSGPTIPLPPNATTAFLLLGADAILHVRRARRRAGEVTAQHGDVVLFKTGPEAVEVEVRGDGLTFLGLARRAYDAPPTEVPCGPLASWYMGPWPLDRSAPLRPHPALVEREPVAEAEKEGMDVDGEKPEAEAEKEAEQDGDADDTLDPADILGSPRFRGVELAAARPEPTLLRAPEHPPLPAIKPERKGTPRGGGGRSRGRGRGGNAAASGASGGRGRARGRGRGRGASSRASTSATPMDDEGEGEDELDDYDDESE